MLENWKVVIDETSGILRIIIDEDATKDTTKGKDIIEGKDATKGKRNQKLAKNVDILKSKSQKRRKT